MDTATVTPALAKLDEVIAELQAIRATEAPLTRAELARDSDHVRSVLARVADEAVWLASNEIVGTHRRGYGEVATYLGVSAKRVANAITAYRRWIAAGAP
jgi:hypothetical protein